jgi:NADH:ubiquinone oxidoreductase subunit C
VPAARPGPHPALVAVLALVLLGGLAGAFTLHPVGRQGLGAVAAAGRGLGMTWLPAPAAAVEPGTLVATPRRVPLDPVAVEPAPAPIAVAEAPAAAAPTAPPAEPEEVVRLREALPDLPAQRVQGYLELKIPKDQLVDVARRLRDDLGYDYLSSVTAVDWRDRIEMVYHIYSFNYLQRPSGVVLRVDLERPALPEYPLCPSLTPVWPGAEFQEREVYDLMGVKFPGHPDLRRILLSDDFPGHPLRKDFVFDYEYVLVRHLSYGVEGQLPAPTFGSRPTAWSQN